jgi:pSer/pThr/pTyr-binding forkhead associated (FHA) protein
MGSLFVTAGPNKGELFTFTADVAVIGRDAGCAFQLTDELVSRKHIRIVFDSNAKTPETGRVVMDLGSANGTLVNGVKINMPTMLKDGDTIVVGNTSLRYASKRLESSPMYYSMQHIPRKSENFKDTSIGERP